MRAIEIRRGKIRERGLPRFFVELRERKNKSGFGACVIYVVKCSALEFIDDCILRGMV